MFHNEHYEKLIFRVFVMKNLILPNLNITSTCTLSMYTMEDLFFVMFVVKIDLNENMYLNTNNEKLMLRYKYTSNMF